MWGPQRWKVKVCQIPSSKGRPFWSPADVSQGSSHGTVVWSRGKLLVRPEAASSCTSTPRRNLSPNLQKKTPHAEPAFKEKAGCPATVLKTWYPTQATWL